MDSQRKATLLLYYKEIRKGKREKKCFEFYNNKKISLSSMDVVKGD
jgi:hypothetical protein